MLNINLLALAGVITGAAASVLPSYPSYSSSVTATCDYFKETYPKMTILPSDANYTAENQVSWSTASWLGPACVLVPANAQDMSIAVKALVEHKTEFAIRGGGHMPNEDAANINSTGILISSTNLKTLQLSDDLGTLSISPGNRWGAAYEYLNVSGTGKMINGGRFGPVGVPGYLIGGGISFFGYEYGFSSTNGNVQGWECVLADGTIAMVTETNEYADLFWSLQGGGNSFCLLTTILLRTFDSPGVGVTNAVYGQGEEIKNQWMDSIIAFVNNDNADPKGGVEAVARYGPGLETPRYDASLFYNGLDRYPEVLSDFQGGVLPASNTTDLNIRSMAGFAELVTPGFEPGGAGYGFRQRFTILSMLATKEAFQIMHDTYFDAAPELVNLDGFYTSMAVNPITTNFLKASNSGIGNPMGVSEVPQLWIAESFSWSAAADDAVIEAWVNKVNANITTQLKAVGAFVEYIYLNDADPNQKVFESYGKDNVERLQSVREKYDPTRVFTDLMPGGFKVADAVI